jgi:hypothetical protein
MKPAFPTAVEYSSEAAKYPPLKVVDIRAEQSSSPIPAGDQCRLRNNDGVGSRVRLLDVYYH